MDQSQMDEVARIITPICASQARRFGGAMEDSIGEVFESVVRNLPRAKPLHPERYIRRFARLAARRYYVRERVGRLKQGEESQ
jgi:hypothetical protein